METFGKFREIDPKEREILLKVYQHIDNGGYTFIIDQYGNLGIEYGFFGYATTRLLLAGIDLDGLIESLQEMKRRLEQEEVARRLKGE